MAAGVTDLITEYALTDEPSFLIGYFNSAPYDNPEIYRKNSPITYASQVKTPVLIVHGENDLRVPISQSYEFYSALKHYNAKAQFVVYPREYHGIREYDHQIDLMNRLLEWFEDHRK
jgi:dipeptidyl aminopeptidase/acylaminoacyl peptidase